jgi:hypothetical protein
MEKKIDHCTEHKIEEPNKTCMATPTSPSVFHAHT